jgi:hypothetical protein
LLDPELREGYRKRGNDPDRLLDLSTEMDNAVIGNHPGIIFGLHLCRGNNQSKFYCRRRLWSHHESLSEDPNSIVFYSNTMTGAPGVRTFASSARRSHGSVGPGQFKESQLGIKTRVEDTH